MCVFEKSNRVPSSLNTARTATTAVNAMNARDSAAFSITAEECRQIEEEEEIARCIYYLRRALGHCSGNPTLTDAIKELSSKTRFLRDVDELEPLTAATALSDIESTAMAAIIGGEYNPPILH